LCANAGADADADAQVNDGRSSSVQDAVMVTIQMRLVTQIKEKKEKNAFIRSWQPFGRYTNDASP
jgi:hypothetical protein